MRAGVGVGVDDGGGRWEAASEVVVRVQLTQPDPGLGRSHWLNDLPTPPILVLQVRVPCQRGPVLLPCWHRGNKFSW
jgi:hypothetical protein